MVKHIAGVLVGMALVVTCGQRCSSAPYTFTDFTVPGTADTFLNSINGSGRVVGVYGEELSPVQGLTPGWNGFVADSDGQNLITLTPHLDATAVEAAAINEQGVVVGSFAMTLDGFETFRGFVFDGSSYQVLQVPFAAAFDTFVANIDDSGVIVGSWSQDFSVGIEGLGSSGFRATPNGSGGYTYEDVDLGDPDPLTISNTFLNGRNAAGQEIATLRRQTIDPGTFEITDEIMGVLLDDVEIKYPEAGVTQISDINDAGTIVGTATFAQEVEPDVFEFSKVAFSVNAHELESLPLAEVSFTDLMIPGHENSFGENETGVEPNGHSGVQAINHDGVIVGFYDNDDGVYRGFIGNPSPALGGDYNQDGVVDAADYTAWRDNLGAPAGTLLNDVDGGPIGSLQYATWKENFGLTSESELAAISFFPIPEPSGLSLMIVGFLLARLRQET